jgi:hypothetical protein
MNDSNDKDKKLPINELLVQAKTLVREGTPSMLGKMIPQDAYAVEQDGYTKVQKKGLRIIKEIDKIYSGYFTHTLKEHGKKRMDEMANDYGEHLWEFKIEFIIIAIKSYASGNERQQQFPPNQVQLLAAIHSLFSEKIPSFDMAFQEAAFYANDPTHIWSHVVVEMATKSSDPSVLRSDPEDRKELFKGNYELYKKRHLAGEDIRKPNIVMLVDKSDETKYASYLGQIKWLTDEHKVTHDKAVEMSNYLVANSPGNKRRLYTKAESVACMLGITLPAIDTTPEHTATEKMDGKAALANLKKMLR